MSGREVSVSSFPTIDDYLSGLFIRGEFQRIDRKYIQRLVCFDCDKHCECKKNYKHGELPGTGNVFERVPHVFSPGEEGSSLEEHLFKRREAAISLDPARPGLRVMGRGSR